MNNLNSYCNNNYIASFDAKQHTRQKKQQWAKYFLIHKFFKAKWNSFKVTSIIDIKLMINYVLLQDGNGSIENEELRGFLKDLLELVKKVLLLYLSTLICSNFIIYNLNVLNIIFNNYFVYFFRTMIPTTWKISKGLLWKDVISTKMVKSARRS